MSRKGNCRGNVVADSFFRTLKTGWYYGNILRDMHCAEIKLFEYIERFYNNQRLHATLGYLTSMEFETMKMVTRHNHMSTFSGLYHSRRKSDAVHCSPLCGYVNPTG